MRPRSAHLAYSAQYLYLRRSRPVRISIAILISENEDARLVVAMSRNYVPLGSIGVLKCQRV